MPGVAPLCFLLVVVACFLFLLALAVTCTFLNIPGRPFPEPRRDNGIGGGGGGGGGGGKGGGGGDSGGGS